MFKPSARMDCFLQPIRPGTRFQAFGGSEGNYHGLDYALFYMDIRENAMLKVKTYLDNNSK
jgi:hypothetical protein